MQRGNLAMGLVSAGTNNSRVAVLLRQLGELYGKEAGRVCCTRIAQALLFQTRVTYLVYEKVAFYNR